MQGESSRTGMPTTFIRLTGCPLRCVYCDSAYAFSGGEQRHLKDLVEECRGNLVRYVTVTGGEPLAQPACIALLTALSDAGFAVSLETSGAMDISNVDSRVLVVMDLKTPGSGECDRNRWENIDHLKFGDEVKFVICSRDDFDWACQVIAEHELVSRCEVLFSPSAGVMDPKTLAEWLLDSRLEARFQVQLHKQLWGDAPGR